MNIEVNIAVLYGRKLRKYELSKEISKLFIYEEIII